MRLFLLQGVSMMTAMRALLAACVLAAAGCTSASLEDAAPRSLLPPPAAPGPASVAIAEPPAAATDGVQETAAPVAPSAGRPRDTRQFPNINVVPKGETAQISPAQRAAAVAELNAARQVQKAAGATAGAGSAAELRQLGRDHARRALNDIESE